MKRKHSIQNLEELPPGWQEVLLEDVASIYMSGVDKISRDGEREVRLCNYLDVYNNSYITSKIPFMVSTASENEISKLTLKRDDVIITKDSETPDDIGVPAVVMEDLHEVVCGYHLALIRPQPKKVSSVFLAAQFKSHFGRKQLNAVANGAIRFGLSVSAIKQFRLMLPPIAEQEKLANLILSMDLEIDLLLRQIEVLRLRKIGVVQKVLSGNISFEAIV